MSHPYQLPPSQALSRSLSVKPTGSELDAGIDINWVLYSPSDPLDCVLVTSMKKHQMSLPFGHLRPFFKILLRREAQRVMEPERIRFWKPKNNLSIFQVSQGWTGKLPNLDDVATELPLPAKLRLVAPEKSAVDDGSGNVHLIITINPTVKIIEEEGTEAREAPLEQFANLMAKQTATAAAGNQGDVVETAKPGKKTKKARKVKSEKNRVRAQKNVLRAGRHTLRISAAPGTSIILPPKVPPHNKKEMDLEKARLINEVNNSESKVVFLGSKETFPGLTSGPPPCQVCKEPVKGLPMTGMLAFEKICFCGFKAFRIARGETTYNADERNEKTLKDRVVRRSIYYHWSCLKDTHKRHYVDTPPIRHSSVDSQNWQKVLSDIKASVGGGKHRDGGKKSAKASSRQTRSSTFPTA
ncbi:hypothetical protein ARMSODRAFT_967045 [Armillaria solidipes]|uniref:Uncharacterized protein n=1 Tax=Armillaria solidipes TaxID=1076256 RepID=A0A2H3AK45_9AGAR|nr:hypothetical protein ARMSODRAFT_967045 [Armillaria solidipes]